MCDLGITVLLSYEISRIRGSKNHLEHDYLWSILHKDIFLVFLGVVGLVFSYTGVVLWEFYQRGVHVCASAAKRKNRDFATSKTSQKPLLRKNYTGSFIFPRKYVVRSVSFAGRDVAVSLFHRRGSVF